MFICINYGPIIVKNSDINSIPVHGSKSNDFQTMADVIVGLMVVGLMVVGQMVVVVAVVVVA